MNPSSEYQVNDVVFHSTPSGIKYIGVVTYVYTSQPLVTVKWWMEGKYFLDSDADTDRITRIGPLPEGVEWDVQV